MSGYGKSFDENKYLAFDWRRKIVESMCESIG